MLRLLTVLFSLIALPAWADVFFVAASSSKDSTGTASTLTLSNVNCGAGNLCKFVLVWRQTASQTASTPTYGGSTSGITLISPTIGGGGSASGCTGDGTTGGCLKTWYACGLTGTQNTVFTVSAGAVMLGAVSVYGGVDCGGTPVGTSVQNDSVGLGVQTGVTTTATATAGGMSVDALYVRDDVEATNTPYAGQTLHTHQSVAGSISMWTSSEPFSGGSGGTVSFTIAADTDDGYEEASHGNSNGSFGLNATLFGRASGPDTDYHVGWRWTGVTLPNGATINSATLKLRARNAVTGTLSNIHGVFRGHYSSNAGVWSTGTLVPTTITNTTANTQYDPAVWVVDDYYNIDVATIVAEIVSHAGWNSGNALSIALKDDGNVIDTAVRFYDYSDGDTESGKLTIDYGGSGGMGWNWTSAQNFVHIVTPLNAAVGGGGGGANASGLMLLGVGR